MAENFIIVVAADEEDGIGIQGRLPWKISSEIKFFRKITTSGESNAIIMGRKTWDSLGNKKLPGRINIILSTSLPRSGDLLTFKSLDEALSHCKEVMISSIWVIGGSQLYQEALLSSKCQGIILSRIKGTHQCDVKFPNISTSDYELRRTDHCDREWSVEYYSRLIKDNKESD